MSRIRKLLQVSIHARAWRATPPEEPPVPDPSFQFTPARGGRLTWREIEFEILVSIHARAWRATAIQRENTSATLFQFTPARGGRRTSRRAPPASRSFNSRPRVAGDLDGCAKGRAGKCFNSRPRVAGDLLRLRNGIETLVSIHARAWRATRPVRVGVLEPPVSIHARAWRATPSRPRDACARRVSIHARAWRATWRTAANAGSFSSFQFTPARGGRPSSRPRMP